MQFVIELQFKTFDTVQPFLVNTLGTHASVRLIQGILWQGVRWKQFPPEFVLKGSFIFETVKQHIFHERSITLKYLISINNDKYTVTGE